MGSDAVMAFSCTMLRPTNKGNSRLGKLAGRYSYIGNPCTTDPCLPGMAYAVLVKDKYYFLTVEDRWFSENRSWEGYMPGPGDPVIITGYLRKKIDVFGKPFNTIEVVSLQPAK